MALSKDELARLYRKRARHYDISANLYYFLGVREFAYRKKAVRALGLKRGDMVVEIGCGTGLNFGLLREAVGSEGRIVGVDFTGEMLAEAAERIAENRWSNIELVQSDAAMYQFPERLDGILSTFAITLMPEYDLIIKRRRGSAPRKENRDSGFQETGHLASMADKFLCLYDKAVRRIHGSRRAAPLGVDPSISDPWSIV